ncbi:Macrolide export ATP-binding/permease protein MacB [Posidoniimonas polymericola]|uniref:Macrolide export ATP-binding/permease protein MacB n=1 Tax=Posidoniimonas polymericola TaxID=2528002 RepID=A0A5C5YQ96_9BACT|nr:ABC transporter permease [Posidoniimonas polymericola]TWT77104.1 Macrolide export ATP-binding/permease protein MacB [Posidoniimonas polymericola]
MRFSRLVTANLMGRPVRSLLTLTGVAVAVGAVVALVGVSDGFEKSLLDAYESRGVDLLVLQAGKVQQTMSVLPESLGDELAKLDGIESFAPGLTDVVSLGDEGLMGVTIQAWPRDSPLLDQFQLIEGGPLSEAGPKTLLIGQSLSTALKKKAGDTIEVYEGEPFTVAGVYESYNVFENGAIVMPLADLQDLMFREGEVTAYTIIGKQHDRPFLEELAAQIRALQPGLEVAQTRDYAENAPELKTARAIAWLTSSIALVVGAVGILNTMLMAVFERTKEIAMMRAVGWRRSRVMRLVMSEALLLAFGGAVLGTLGAIVLLRLLAQTPSAGRIVSGDISGEVVLQGFVVAMLLGLLGGLYPAYRAARLTPIEGLRHE